MRNNHFRDLIAGNSRTVWIRGGPGKGKTIISIFLTEQKHSHEVIYYFCAAEDAKRNNAAAILRVLLWQLIVRHQDAEKLIDELHPWLRRETQAEQVVSTAETLWHIFVELTSNEKLTKTLCIIDGLDECAEESRLWLARKLVAWDKSRAKHALRILVTSRPMMNLSGISQVDLDARDAQGVAADIKTFVSASVADLEKGIAMKNETLQQIKQTLVSRSEGTFLWVGFAVAELRKAQTEMEVLATIRSHERLPSGLAPIYGRILTSIGAVHKEPSRKLLQWVTVSARPLSLYELAFLAHCGIGDTTSMYGDVKDRIRLCGPLLRYQIEDCSVDKIKGQGWLSVPITDYDQAKHTPSGDNKTAHLMNVQNAGSTVANVRFVHESFRDYLTRSEPDTDVELESFRVKEAAANFEAAQTCFQAIGKEGPLQIYAISYWPYHAKRSGKFAVDLLEQERRFFQRRSSMRNEWWAAYQDRPLKKHQDLPRIHLAAWLGLEWWIEAIIAEENGIVNEVDHHGRMPLDYAISRGHTFAMHCLIKHGASIAFHSPAILHAAQHGYLDMARLLIQHGADLRVEGKDDCYNPLMTAVYWGHHAMVRLFLVSGVDVRHPNGKSETAMHALFRATHLPDNSFDEMMDLLLGFEPRPDPHATNAQGQTLLHVAVWKGKRVQTAIDMGCDVAAIDGQGNTPLHLATAGRAGLSAARFTVLTIPAQRHYIIGRVWRLTSQWLEHCSSMVQISKHAMASRPDLCTEPLNEE